MNPTGERSGLPPFTLVNAVLLACAVVMLLGGTFTTSAVAASVAHLLMLFEFKRNTGRAQIALLVANAVLIGAGMDLHAAAFPVNTLALLALGAATVLRQAFMQRFTYIALLWVEPLLLVGPIVLFGARVIAAPVEWMPWAPALVPLAGACALVFGYVQDGALIKKSVRHGYRIGLDTEAPDFELPDADGQPVRLRDHRGEAPVLLLFVRGDWCPGCHMMLRTYEKHRERFQEKGIVLLAIGPDASDVNRDMAERLGVRFRILSDPGQRVSDTYGVVYNNPLLEAGIDYAQGIPLPASFLIDRDGLVRYVSRPERVGEFLRPENVFTALEGIDRKTRAEWKRA